MTRPPRRVSKGRRSTTRDRASLSSSPAVKSYKIGEAAHLVGVKPYVLRFWESEFPILRPAHTQSKHRVYLDKDIEMLRLVRKLLHEERFTIEGAKRRIKELGLHHGRDERHTTEPAGESTKTASGSAKPSQRVLESAMKQTMLEIRRDLQSLLRILSS
jgi:DNA-binding transcriptional MerR regulator